MNWDCAYKTAVGYTAGAGIGHAFLTAEHPSAWLVLLGGVAMVFIIYMGVTREKS